MRRVKQLLLSESLDKAETCEMQKLSIHATRPEHPVHIPGQGMLNLNQVIWGPVPVHLTSPSQITVLYHHLEDCSGDRNIMYYPPFESFVAITLRQDTALFRPGIKSERFRPSKSHVTTWQWNHPLGCFVVVPVSVSFPPFVVRPNRWWPATPTSSWPQRSLGSRKNEQRIYMNLRCIKFIKWNLSNGSKSYIRIHNLNLPCIIHLLQSMFTLMLLSHKWRCKIDGKIVIQHRGSCDLFSVFFESSHS